MDEFDPLLELREKHPDIPTKVEKIKKWLEKYKSLFDYYEKVTFCRENGKACIMGVLMTCNNPDLRQGCDFMTAYNGLLATIELHKNEPIFKEIVAEYKLIENNKRAIIDWVIKNEELGYSDIYSTPQIGIMTDLIEFKYSYAFQEHFWNNIYYVAKYRGEIIPQKFHTQNDDEILF
ncbi:hypothetical protein [Flavobacterium psychrophilum]|uniref:hypothetical protein n=1 Tax=Flavobacterium psychrophilum TaxID=96345 RepID=UPI00106953FE|nr:hypothetical protein [Flavobacterium psychrophilum]